MITAFVLVVSGLGIAQLNQQVVTAAEAATPISHTVATPPVWRAQTNFKAVWARPLTEEASYWTHDNGSETCTATTGAGSTGAGRSSNGVSCAQVGGQSTILWESYDFNDDMTQFKTRPTLVVERTVSGGDTALPGEAFTTLAIGRFGGTNRDPDAPLEAWFWGNDGANSLGPQTCGAGTETIVRIKSMDPVIYTSCMPRMAASTSYPPATGTANAMGGEMDQQDGTLYVSQAVDPQVDTQAYNARTANTSGSWVFSAWNPVTGAYSLSGPVQPGDWSYGMTVNSQERVRLYTRLDGQRSATGTVHAPSDFSLDADGNLFQYVSGNDSTVAGTALSATGNLQILRVEPAKDSQGRVIDGTRDNPWRYYVISKITKDPAHPNDRWERAGATWGNGFVKGQMLMGASSSTPSVTAANSGAAAMAGQNGTTTMVAINPMSRTAHIAVSIENGYLPTSTTAITSRDNGSAEPARTIRGVIYNDANANSSLDTGELGVPDVTVAIYDSAGKLLGSAETDASGTYSFVVAGARTDNVYLVRPVQVQIPLVPTDETSPKANAVQTWGSGGVESSTAGSAGTRTNTFEVQCYGPSGNISSDAPAACWGAKAQNTPDPAVGAVGTTSDPATWLSYAKVTYNTTDNVPNGDFGFTIRGSYGDAAAGPTATGAFPVHINSLDPAQQVWLGDAKGANTGPAIDDSHGTDDGIYIDSALGKIYLTPNTTIAATKQYTLVGQLSGDAKSSASVKGWVTGAGNNTWNTTAVWSPTVSGDTVSGPFQYQASGAVTGTPKGQLRTEVSTATITAPTNANNEYQAAVGDSAKPWTTNGEIEDYTFNLADAVYRPAAITTAGSGTFTVDSQGLTADTTVKIGNPVATSAQTPKTVNATTPNTQWIVKNIEVLDTLTGQAASGVNATTPTGLNTGSGSITFTPRLGDDLTIKVTYGKPPAPDQSTLVIYTDQAQTQEGNTASVGGTLWAIATVKNADGEPMPGEQVTFSKTSDAITLNGDLVCTTNASGQCGVQVTSTVAGTYANEVHAKVANASGTLVEVGPTSGTAGKSPATVVFVAGGPDPAKSNLTVSKTTAGATSVVANGSDSWTATATLRDADDNPVPNYEATFKLVDPATGSPNTTATPSGSGKCTTNAQGVCSITVTDTKAETVNVVLEVPAASSGQMVGVTGSPQPIDFVPGPVCVPGSGVANCLTKVEVTRNDQLADNAATDQMTATAYDANGNRVPGVQFSFAASGSALTLVDGGTCTTQANGTCVKEARTNTVGTYPVTASVSGTNLTPPLELRFVAGEPDLTASTLVVSPATTSVGGTATATVTTKDAQGNLIGGQTVTFTKDSTVAQWGAAGNTCTTATSGDNLGKCSVTLTDTRAETVAVSAAISKGTLTASPQSVKFEATDFDPTKSTFTVNPTAGTSVRADGSQSWTAELTARDSSENQLTNLDPARVAFEACQGTGSARVCTNVTASNVTLDSATGRYKATLTSTKAGDYDVTASYGGQATSDSTKPISFVAGPADPTHSTIEVDQTTASAGGNVKVTLTARDAFDNPVSGATFQTSVPTSTGAMLNGAKSPSCGPTNAQGVCELTLTDTRAERVPVTATLNGTQIKDSPVTVEFQTTGFDPANSTFTVTPSSSQPVDGGSFTATLLAKDAQGNALPGLTNVTFPTDSAVTVSAVTESATTPGTYTATLTSRTPGTYQVAAASGGIETNDSSKPITFTPGPAKPGTSEIAASPPSLGINETASATVTTKDAFGNLTGGQQVSIQLSGNATFKTVNYCTTGTSGADLGKCTVEFTDATAQIVNVTGLIGSDIINGSPKQVEFTVDKPNPVQSTLTVDKASAEVGTNVVATVTAKDAGGNLVGGYTVPVTVDGSATISGGPCVTNNVAGSAAFGTCQVTITDTKAETVNVKATVTNDAGQPVDITGSPKPVEFTAQPVPSVTTSTMELSKTSATVGESVTATVTAKDQYGNPVGGYTVPITLDPSSPATVSGTCVTNNVKTSADYGKCSVTLNDTKAETVEVSAKVNGTNIQYSPQTVTWGFGDVDPDASLLSVSPNPQTAGANATVKVTVIDRSGNRVTGLTSSQIQVAGTDANSTGLPSLTMQNFAEIGNGEYTYTTTSYDAGTFRLVGTVNGTRITQQPTETFVSGAVCVGDCTPTERNAGNITRFAVLAEDNGKVAGGSAQDVVTAYAYDRYGNPVQGAAVKLTDYTAGALANILRAAGSTAVPAVGEGTTGANGQARVGFTSTQAGGYVVQGTIANLLPASAVQNLNFVSGNVDPTKSTLELSTPRETVAVAVTATVTLRDANNNLVDGETVSLGSDPAKANPTNIKFGTAAGPSNTTCVSGTAGAGKCTVTFTSTIAGDYGITASVGSPVSGSPAPITFVAEDEICTQNCAGEATNVKVTKDNARNNDTDQDIVTASVYDKYGNAISGATVTTSVPSSALHPVATTVSTGTEGTAQVRYTTLVEGPQTVNLTITKGSSTVTLPATMTFLSVPPDPAQSSLSISPTTSQQVDTPFTLTATIKGSEGQPINNATATFSLPSGVTSLTGGNQCNTGTSGAGTCFIQVISTKAGTYEIGATVADSAGVQTRVTNSPVTAIWTAGPVCSTTPDAGAPTTSVAIVASTNGAKNDDIERVAAAVRAYDCHGNPVQNAVVASTTTDSALHIVSPIAPTDVNGESTIYYTSLVAGGHDAAVTVSSGSVTVTPSGSPVRPSFSTVDPDPTLSSFTVQPLLSSQTAPLTVGTEDANKYQVTATVRGAQNQLLQGAVVTFEITPTEGVTWTNNVKTCETDSLGVCSVTMSSTKSGPFDVTASVKTGSIGQAKSATWKADAVSAAESYLTVTTDNSPADGTTTNLVTATARDRYRNPVPGAMVVSTKVNSADTITIQGDVEGTSETTGQTTIWYTSTLAGPHEVAVTINGLTPTGNLPSPVTINFRPGIPSATTSTLEVDKNSARVGETVTATVTAKDKDGNLVGNVPITVSVDGQATMNPSSPATCTTSGTAGAGFGKCQVTITDQKAETVNVKATLNGADISGSTKPVVFGFGDVDPNKSLLEVSPTTQTAGADALVRVTVKDASDNGITGLTAAQIAVVGTDKGTTGLPSLAMRDFAELGNGVYTYATTSQDVGTFNLAGTVTIGDKAVTITQKPDVTFTAGDVCVGAACQPTEHNAGNVTRFVVTVQGKLANGSEEDAVTAYAYDTYGNPVNNAAVRIEDKSTGDMVGNLRSSSGTSVGTANTSQDGTAIVRFKSTKAGDFPVEGTIGGQSPDSRSQTLTFVPSDIDYTKSTLTLSASTATVDVPVIATAKIVDANNNPIRDVTVTFGGSTADVKFNGSPTATTATCQTGTNGECSVPLTSQKAGSYTVSATAGSALSGSPKPVTFTAEPTPCVNSTSTVQCAKPSYVEVTKNGALNDDTDQDILTAHVFDRFGNELSGVVVTTTPASSAVHPVVAATTSGADGTAVLRYTSLVKGRSNVTVLFNNIEPKDASGPSPVELSFVDVRVDPAQSRIDITPTTSQSVTSEFTVTATTKGAQGQLVEGAGVKFSAPADVTFVNGVSTCTSDQLGVCSVKVVSTKPGTYQIGATVPNSAGVDTQVVNSPVSATWTVGQVCLPPLVPDTGVPVTSVTMTRNGALNNDTDVNVATVRAYDCKGNPVSGVTVVSAPSNAADTDLHIQAIAPTATDGTTQIYYTSLVAGEHQALVTIGGVQVTGSPVKPTFATDEPDPTKSSFTVTPKVTGSATPLTVGEADANTYVVTATIKGAANQVLPGQVATFAIDQAGTSWTTQQSCTTGTNGTCSVEIRSTKAGTFTITANTAKGPMVGDSVPAKSAIWKADAADATHSWVEMTTPSATANGNSQAIATVHVLDKYDNPVSGERPASTKANSADVLTIQSAPEPTTSAGTTTIYYQSTVAGTYNANVLVGGQPVSGTKPNSAVGPSPVTMTFVPGPVDITNGASLTVSTTTPTAGEPITATVTARDANGNLIGGQPIVVSSDGSSVMSPTAPYTCTTNNVVGDARFGTCQVTITDDVAEAVQVTAQIDGTNIKNSPTTVTFSTTCVYGIDEGCPEPPPGTPRSEVTVTKNDQRVKTGVDEATVKIFDRLGNPVSDPGYVITSTPDNSPQLSVGTIPALANGQTVIGYTSSANQAVTHTAKVFVKGVELKNPSAASPDASKSSPVSLRFTVGAPCVPGNPDCPIVDPDHMSSLAVDQDVVVVGTTVTATVTARDADGNFVGNVPILVTFSGEAFRVESASSSSMISLFSFSETCVTNNAGTCQVQFTDNLAETIQVRATINGADVLYSPLPVTFTTDCVPGVDPGCVQVPGTQRSYVEITRNNQVAGSDRPDQVTVHVFDRLGNPVSTGYTVTSVADSTQLIVGTIPALANGQTVIGYSTSNLMDQSYTATVSIRNSSTGAAAEIKYVDDAGVADPSKSSPVSLHFLRGGQGYPDAPVITSPQPGPNKDRPLTVTGTGEPGSTVTITDTDDNGNPVACTPTPVTVGADGTWTCQVSLPDGQHTLVATVTDPAGNKSPDSDSVRINTDTVKPDAPVVNHPDGPTNDTTPQFDGTAEPGSTVTVKDEGGRVLCAAVANSTTGAWACSPTDDRQLSEGDHQITVTATDPAGNVSDPTTKTVTIDTTPPAAPVINVANETEISGTGEAGGTVTVTDEGGRVLCTAPVNAQGNWTCQTPAGTPSGKIYATVTDPAGNTGPAKEGVIDTEKPAAPVIKVANEKEISGTGEPGATITVVDKDDNVLCETIIDSEGKWTCQTPAGTPSGEIRAWVTDPAGNVGPSQTANLDTERPRPPVVDPTDGSVITGTGEPGGKVTVTGPDGQPIPGCVDVAINATTGRFLCVPTTPLTPGTVISVTVTDPAGNVSDPTVITVTPRESATDVVGTGGTVIHGGPLGWLAGLIVAGMVALVAAVALRREEART